MSTTPGLSLVEHAEAGVNGFIVANTAYRWLEALAGTVPLQDLYTTTPPVSPAEGDLYVAGLVPTGAWSGHGGELAMYLNGAWDFKAPKAGMRLQIAPGATHVGAGSSARHNGSAWFVDRLQGSVAPTVGDDLDTPFGIGSRWIDAVADKAYVCLDATVGAAVWKETTGAGGGGAGDPDQNIWLTVDGDTGSTAANNTADTLTIAGGNACSTAMAGDTLTVAVDDASSAQKGALPTSMWAAIRKAEFFAAGKVIELEQTAAQPGAPAEGDAYVLPASPTGIDWAGNGGKIALFIDAAWLFFAPVDGMRVNVSNSATSFLAGALAAYSEAESQWYPVQQLDSSTLHWTGRFNSSGKKIYAKHFAGPALGTANVDFNIAHGVTDIDLSELAAVRGWMGRSAIAVAIPQNFASIVVECRVSAPNISIKSTLTVTNYAYEVRLECCRTPEPS